MTYKKPLLACLLISKADASWARLCKSPSLQEAYEKADVVFAGRLDAIKGTTEKKDTRTVQSILYHDPENPKTLPPREQTRTYYETIYVFEAMKVWKGDVTQTKELMTMHSRKDTRHYELDGNYLFFANEHESGALVAGCKRVESLGLVNGYLVTLLLDKLNPDAIEILGNKTIDNSYVGAPVGMTGEEGFRTNSRMEPSM